MAVAVAVAMAVAVAGGAAKVQAKKCANEVMRHVCSPTWDSAADEDDAETHQTASDQQLIDGSSKLTHS